MEIKFDIIKPNLYIANGTYKDAGEVYFSLSSKKNDLISASRHVDRVVKDSFGKLKVRKSDIETAEGKAVPTDTTYTVPLEQYLKKLEERIGELFQLTDWTRDSFGLYDLLYAHTDESSRLTEECLTLRGFLDNFDSVVKELKMKQLILNIESTRESMSKRLEELSKSAGNLSVAYHVEHGTVPGNVRTITHYPVGRITIYPMSPDDRPKIVEAQTYLAESLKQFDGPPLSLEAPKYMHQSKNLYDNAPKLVMSFGDILGNPGWRNHLLQIVK